MLVSHVLDDKRVQKDVADAGFLLTNKHSGYLNLGIATRYRGLFFRLHGEIIKIIDDIRIQGEVTELRNTFWGIIRSRWDAHELFFMPFSDGSMAYELSSEQDIEILFDVKKAYDNRVWGRNYHIWQEEDKVIIEFIKKTDSKEDNSHDAEEYRAYICIHHEGTVEMPNEWEQQHYYYDAERKSFPAERHVFKGLKIRSSKLFIAASERKEDAVRLCRNLTYNFTKFKNVQKEYAKVSVKDITDTKLSLAAKCASDALSDLVVNESSNAHLYAGLPWFFQYWSRDTFISLKALIIDKEYSLVKKILMMYLKYFEEDGLLPNRIPGSSIKAMDAIGWYFQRWKDFLDVLKEERVTNKYLKKSELTFITKMLENSLDKVFKHYTRDNYALNADQETWMDSLYRGSGRGGIRIEIQALRIAMYETLAMLTERNIYSDMARKLRKKVKTEFWNGRYLKDGLTDETIRPNVFIAAYLCPELLTQEEWVRCFDHVLPKLWLEWGGLSTIDKEHADFHPSSTGEDPSSYHRGDSWFWINNLAAIVLCRTDKGKYKSFIDKIIGASSEDILFNGYIGCHSETSSASLQRAEGCLSQAWSNAMFIELIEEITKTD